VENVGKNTRSVEHSSRLIADGRYTARKGDLHVVLGYYKCLHARA